MVLPCRRLALMPVLVAAFHAGAAILTRARCASVAPVVPGVWLNADVVAFAAAMAGLSLGLPLPIDYPLRTGGWAAMTARIWTTIAVLAALRLGVAFGVARACQLPRPEVMANFDYAQMVYAAVFCLLLFGKAPDLWTLVGTVLTAAGGLILGWGWLFVRGLCPRAPGIFFERKTGCGFRRAWFQGGVVSGRLVMFGPGWVWRVIRFGPAIPSI